MIRRGTSSSLVGRPRRRRALFRGLPQNVQVHGQLAHLALEPIDLLLAQDIFLFRPRAQGVLRAEQKALPSLLHLGYFKSMPPCCLSCCRLTSEHADYQGCATLRRPALYFLGLLFVCHWPPRRVSSTLYYWWLDLKGVQDRCPLSVSLRVVTFPRPESRL